MKSEGNNFKPALDFDIFQQIEKQFCDINLNLEVHQMLPNLKVNDK